MTNDIPRAITPEEIQVGDTIRTESNLNGVTYSETLTVARVEDRDFFTPEGGWTCIGDAATVILLDRPEPEPEWVADGICVDENGDTWALYSGEWYYPGTDGYSAKELQIAHGPISRHPAVVAAEKRGELRGLDAVGEALDSHPGPCDEYTDGDPVTCGWKSAVADVHHVIEGWAS